jgi:uncharacterized protein YbbK (DUF523 family)
LVSPCLCSVACRYDGAAKESFEVQKLVAVTRTLGWSMLPVCTEVLARLGVPRPPMSFVGGGGEQALAGEAGLRDERGVDVTAAMLEGAERAWALAEAAKCRVALLKERSPSCGLHQVYVYDYDARPSRSVAGANQRQRPKAAAHETKLVEGRGVTSALLMRGGVRCFSEDEVGQAERWLKEEVGLEEH